MRNTMQVAQTQPQRACTGRRNPELGLCARLLYHLSRWARRCSAVHQSEDLARTTNDTNYRSWRRTELDRQLSRHFDVTAIARRDVLDFGCGTGELCDPLIRHRPKSVTGVDTSGPAITCARENQVGLENPSGGTPRFIHNENHKIIPLGPDRVDLICCFDVVEHIPDLTAVAYEWRRVLRPDGRVWIWWSPWRGPYGHHLESLIPLPWVHLLFPEKTLFATCAELYEDPDFVPRQWDREPTTGSKRPNKWRNTKSFEPFLNRLTRHRFERTIKEVGLRVIRRETHGFSGSTLRKATRLLSLLPLIGECFVSYYIYELSRG